MLVKIDATAEQFTLVKTEVVNGDQRHYYVHSDRLMIIVCRDWLELPPMVGFVVDAAIGWDDGTPGFVKPANEGKRHSKLTIYRTVSAAPPDSTLAQILSDAPVNEGERPGLEATDVRQ